MTTRSTDTKLTVAAFLSRTLADLDRPKEDLEAAIGASNMKIVLGVIAGTLKLPAERVFAIAKAIEIDPALLMRIYLRDYCPELEQAIFDCEGTITATKSERLVLAAFRSQTHNCEPGVLVFEGKKVLALALALV